MIEAVGLTKSYGDKTAVYQLSFQVRPGVVTGFLGPNGSGKSTTMRMTVGLDEPTAGTVTVNGLPYRRLPNAARQVGALLDAKAVHGGRSAREHLLCLAQLSGVPSSRVDEVIDVVGLGEVAHKRSKGFSLGMGQRLGIAGALLGDPPVLLFDEPVNGLDPEGILWIRNLMKQLASEGRTVLVSSHLMSEMALTADHLIVIGRGQLLADMSVKDFIAHNSQGYARVRVPEDRPDDPEKLRTALARAGGQLLPEEDGGFRVTGLALPQISDLAHEADVRLWELSPHHASLEEAYMQMTQGAVDYRATVDTRSSLQPLPQGMPGQGHAPQGHAPQGHGYPAGPGHPAPGAQGYPQQGYAPQPMPQQPGTGYGTPAPGGHPPQQQPWPGGAPGTQPYAAPTPGAPTSDSEAAR